MDKECSVIIPFCNEMPQVVFTIQSVIEELDGFCKYEILAIDNMSDDTVTCTAGDRTYPLRSRSFFSNHKGTISTWFFRKKIIKYLKYDGKQGHWNAKNYGIENSSGKYIMFLDAHCIMKRDSIRKMIQFLRETEEPVGGVHPYICYMLDSHRLEYKVQAKFFGYQFCSAQPGKTEPYKVCVMSTCGMMSPRSVFDELGAWNSELGIYGGGESYINWKQSTCGYPHYIHPEAVCWHYADKRGYSWNHTDYVRNSFIAAYCVGGEKWLNQQVSLRKKKDKHEVIDRLRDDVIAKCKPEREFIKSRQTVTFDDYIDYWEKNPGVWK
jgi:glycosyltransferase involved in cell wall biosynthesis